MGGDPLGAERPDRIDNDLAKGQQNIFCSFISFLFVVLCSSSVCSWDIFRFYSHRSTSLLASSLPPFLSSIVSCFFFCFIFLSLFSCKCLVPPFDRLLFVVRFRCRYYLPRRPQGRRRGRHARRPSVRQPRVSVQRKGRNRRDAAI
jgi:hypothetical protein